ncbi:MAG: hypothetical protein ACHQM6_09275 [Candidatus Kapaibacterium sp.]
MKYTSYLLPVILLSAFLCSSCKQSTDSGQNPLSDSLIVGAGGNIGHDLYYSNYFGLYPTSDRGVRSLNFDGSGASFLFRKVYLYSSPRASKMVFASKGTLYLADISGKSAEKLFTTGPDIQYAILSPDGQKVIYATLYNSALGLINDSVNIYDINTHSHTPLAVPDFHLISGDLPAFSDDSKKIVLTFGNTHSITDSVPLFVVNSDGTGLAQIASDATVNSFSEVTPYFWQLYSWSPDGKSICYDAPSGSSSTSDRLMIVDIASGVSQKISDTAYAPKWSPSGNFIAFTRDFPNSISRIAIFDVHTKQIRFIDPAAPYTGGAEVIDWTSDEHALIVGASQADPKLDGSTLLIDAATGNTITNYLIHDAIRVNIHRAKALGEH